MKLEISIEIKKMEEEGENYSRETVYEQRKEFQFFDIMKVINAFNSAETDHNIFVVDPAKMNGAPAGKMRQVKKEDKNG